MAVQAEAFFLPAEPANGGQRFCLFYAARGSALRGSVLYVHPFAEEMNKARRMAALQARALARAGFDVLQMDLLGCGDSSGDFGDATWSEWVNDVVRGCDWLRSQRHLDSAERDKAPLWLWGLRAGCLLAVQAAEHLREDCNFLFWQPPSAGKPLLQQFLRLKVAGDLAGAQSSGLMAAMRAQLASGASVDIAGYRLSSALALGLEQAVLAPPTNSNPGRRLEWFELSNREDNRLSPAASQTIAQWQQSGFSAASHIVPGPAFWQTSEIEEAPALIAATTVAMTATVPATLGEALPA